VRADNNFGNVMPLGDSITWGDAYSWSGGHWGVGDGIETPIPGGYRDPLYRILTNAGATLQFVGTKNDNATELLASVGETANEGHGGYFTGNLSDNLDGSAGGDTGYWLTGTASRPPVFPDSVLLMAGTNNLISSSNAGYTYTDGIDSLVSHIFQLRPNTHLYLSTLLPIPDFPSADAAVRTFNDFEVNGYAADNNFPSQVAKYTAMGFNITQVDAFAQFVNSDGSDNLSLFADGVHPNQMGYNVLGQTWAAAMLSGQGLHVSGPVTLRPSAGFVLGQVELSRGCTLTLAGPVGSTMLPTLLNGIASGSIAGDGSDPVAAVTMPDGSVEVGCTILGDTDFDGRVNVADLANLAANFGAASGATWLQGDFDFDSNVNVADLADLAGNFGDDINDGGDAAAVSPAGVPEPSMLAMVVGAALLIPRRRKLRNERGRFSQTHAAPAKFGQRIPLHSR
jgi:lysophospholipase L1-like esterase